MNYPTLIIEIAPDAGVQDYIPSYDPTWIDITNDVISISTRRGRSQENTAFTAGTATIVLDNELGTYTPENVDSTYYGRLTPMCPIRIRATYGATTYPIYRGFIQRFIPTWSGGGTAVVACECADGFVYFAKQKVSFSLGADLTSNQIGAIINYSKWPLTLRTVDASFTSGIAATLANQNVLSYMQDLERMEDGQLFMDASGYLIFHDRLSRTQDARSVNVQATFGYDPQPTIGWILGNTTLSILGSTTIPRFGAWISDATTEQPYLSATIDLSDRLVVNEAIVTRTGGSPQTATDEVSQARYGTRTYTDTLPSPSDTDMLTRAQRIVDTYKTPALRIDRLVVSAHQDDALWPILLYLEISDRVLVVVRPFAGTGIGLYCWIEGIACEIAVTESSTVWDVTYTLSPADPPY